MDRNDKPFLSTFPYLAGPHEGFDSGPSTRTEPGHPPIPAGRLDANGGDEGAVRKLGSARRLRRGAGGVLPLNGGSASPPGLPPAPTSGRPRATRCATPRRRSAPRPTAGGCVRCSATPISPSARARPATPRLYSRAERTLRRGPAPRPARRRRAHRRRHAGRPAPRLPEQLRLGRRPQAGGAGLARPYGVIVDAQVELGRYATPRRSIQRMVDLKPDLASYARVSYFRELSGDMSGAVEAMRLAVSAGGAPENSAFVQTLLGDLELARGRRARHVRLPLRRCATSPATPPAPRARADGRGERRPATGRRSPPWLRRSAAAHDAGSTLLAEVELARGAAARPRADLASARVQQLAARTAGGAAGRGGRPLRGQPRLAALVRSSWAGASGAELRASAPQTRSAGRSPGRAGRAPACLARRALRLGSRDPLFRYHAGDGGAARWPGGARPRVHLARALTGERRCRPRPSGCCRGRAVTEHFARMSGSTAQSRALSLVAAVFVVLSAAPAALAHPLGNFTINHL